MPFDPLITDDTLLDLVQGSALSVPWTFTDRAEDGTVTDSDLSGVTAAELRIGKDTESPALITVTLTPSASGSLTIAANVLTIALTATATALNEASFKGGGCDESFDGLMSLFFTEAGSKKLVAQGGISFTPTVEP